MNTTQSLSEKKQDYYEVAASWHDDILMTKDKHIYIYRILCFGLFVCLATAIMSINTLLSRETVQPFLVLMDKRTGEVTTPTRLNAQSLTNNWPMIRYFAKHYVIDKESYNSQNINEPYKNILSMSESPIVAQIDQYIRPELNPESPIKTLGQHHYVTVTIHSISKLSSNDKLLDVRFTTNTINTADNKLEKSQEWRVVMGWDLVNRKRSLQELDQNPLGFTVNLYDKQPIV
jgi:type IV secretory pathway component VirB8